jgi:hypothetical protein
LENFYEFLKSVVILLNTFMKNFLYLFLIIFFVSCKKDNTDPVPQEPGLLEGYIKENPSITVQKTTESAIPYEDGYATNRGYHFTPLKNIKITAIGGRIAEKGMFTIKIRNIDNGWSKGEGWIDVLVDSINITSTSKFMYKTVDKDVILSTGHKYLISYFNKSHNSLYDAKNSADPGYIGMPLIIQDVQIEREYYSYEQHIIGGYMTMQETFTNALGILRGLVDMKYEVVE